MQVRICLLSNLSLNVTIGVHMYLRTTSCMISDIAPLPQIYTLTAILSLQVCFLGGCCDEDIQIAENILNSL